MGKLGCAAVVTLLSVGQLGCGEETTTADLGSVDVRFSVSNGVRMNSRLADLLKGTIYGELFLSADVTVGGPVAGAAGLASVELVGVDLEQSMESQSWVSPDLPVGNYIFLGFFDVDGNGAETKDPDTGDPVTLPSAEYYFDVSAGARTPHNVVFDLIYDR